MPAAARFLLVASACVAAVVACGADEGGPGLGSGSSGTIASSSGGGTSSGDAAATSSGAPADDGGGPTGRDVPIGMGGPTASSSGTPDAAVGLQCLVSPTPQLTATACKVGRIAVDPLGQLQQGIYSLTGYWNCMGFNAVAGRATIYVENGMVGMRYVRVESSSDAGSGPADTINGTWRLVMQGAGAMTRQDVCGMQANAEPESAEFNYENGILKIALVDHDERWIYEGP